MLSGLQMFEKSIIEKKWRLRTDVVLSVLGFLQLAAEKLHILVTRAYEYDGLCREGFHAKRYNQVLHVFVGCAKLFRQEN